MENSILFSHFRLKGFRVKNRIVMPPMVCIGYSDETGIVSERHIRHYSERALNGAGIIIQEATAVMKNGRTAPGQLGIWGDEHIEGLSEISTIIRGNGALALIQLHHAGIVSPDYITGSPAGPSADPEKPGSREMSDDEVAEVITAFIDAAGRAREAGFDGIELHGAHGYLLNQFANPSWNRRTGIFGETFGNRLRPAVEIIRGVRKLCGPDFIIGYRMGVNTPTLEDGIITAQYLEQTGIDYLHVSHGGNLRNLPRPPKDFPFNWIVYSGASVKARVGIPVIAVNEIKTAERAESLISSEMADFVALGRPILADPAWVHHVYTRQAVNECLSCKPKCRWYEDSRLCPALKRLEKQEPTT